MDWKQGSVASLDIKRSDYCPTGVQCPYGLSVDRSGNIFVADRDAHCISRIDVASMSGVKLQTTGVGGSQPASRPTFNNPYGVAVAEDGTVYVADTDNHVIRKIVRGELSTVAGSGIQGFKDGPPSQACFNNPMGLVLMRDGSIIVADYNNHRIRKVSPRGVVSTLAGSGQQGSTDGPFTEASFSHPRAVAMGPNDQYVLVGDDNGSIRKVSLPEDRVSTVASGFSYPSGLLVDCRGNVIVADAGKHQISFCTPLGVIAVIAGKEPEAFKDGPSGDASFNWPSGLALDPQGRVLVADSGNQRIRALTLPSMTKLQAELYPLQANVNLPPGCSVRLSATSLFKCTAVLPKGPLRGCQSLELSLEMPFDYPVGSPIVKFVGSVIPNHPQVNLKTGEVTLSVKWDHTKSLACILADVHAMLVNPRGWLLDCRDNCILTQNQNVIFRTPQGLVSTLAEYPFALSGLAIDSRGAVTTAAQTLILPSAKRLQSELDTLTSTALPAGCSVTSSATSLFRWVALLQVAEGPFRGGLFELCLEMPFDYPVDSPIVKFVPPITHPNVDPVTGEVSVAWTGGGEPNAHGESKGAIVQCLRQIQEMLKYPKLNSPQAIPVRNYAALKCWRENRTSFDVKAYAEARQSWRHKLKPSDANELVCDLLMPAKHTSRESQHELFQAVATPEIETYVNEKYNPKQPKGEAEVKNGRGSVGLDSLSEHRDDIADQLLRRKKEVKHSKLKKRLTKTSGSLLDLRNPRADLVGWLEHELARLCVAEANEQRAKLEEVKEGLREQEEDIPQGVLSLLRGKARPSNSEQCFELLVAEAEEEARRLGEKIADCVKKYELLYSRFKRALQIEDVPGREGEVRQQLEGSHHVLIAQAKQLEPKLRREFCGLVDLFNKGKKANTNDNGNNASFAQIREAIASSTLCLSSGLRVQVKFGPGKSQSRLIQKMEKGPPQTVLDYTRATVVFADPLLLALFYECFEEKFEVVRVTNKFLLVSPSEKNKKKKNKTNKNNKTRGKAPFEEEDEGEEGLPQPPNVHVNYLFEGHVCEVQLFLEDFLWIKEHSHKPYEIVRLARDKKSKMKKTDAKLREAIEHIIAEGVYELHPGPCCYPSSSSSLLLLGKH